jgi:hypothetical protein
MKLGFNFLFALWIFAGGLACIFFPQWFYKPVSPEQVARDRRRFRLLGYVLTPLGLAGMLIELLRH